MVEVKELKNRVYFIRNLIEGGNFDEKILLSLYDELKEIDEKLKTLS